MVQAGHPIVVSLATWNGARWLPYCLAALARSSCQEYFLMVVDNASADGSAELVQQFLHAHPALAARSRLAQNRANAGFARAHNQVLAWTKHPYVLVLNQDVVLGEAYLGELLGCLAHDDRAAAATGTLVRWNFDPATSYLGSERAEPQVIDSCGLRVTRGRRVVNLRQGEPVERAAADARRVFGVTATAALYRRQALEDVSRGSEVFDEDFTSYKEDVDLAWRLTNAGYDAWHLPQARAYHDRSVGRGGSLWGEVRLRQQRHREHRVQSYTNHLLTLAKNERLANLARDWPWIAWHELGKALFLALTDPGTLLRGLARFARLLPRALAKRRQLRSTQRRSSSEVRQWWSSHSARV